MSSVIIPGKEVKSTFVFKSNSQLWLECGNDIGTITLRPFKSKKKEDLHHLC